MMYQTISTHEWDKLTKKPTIKLTSRARVYSISSQTKAGIFYIVSAVERTCSCPAGRHDRNCWHKAFVMGYDEWRMQQQQTEGV